MGMKKSDDYNGRGSRMNLLQKIGFGGNFFPFFFVRNRYFPFYSLLVLNINLLDQLDEPCRLSLYKRD